MNDIFISYANADRAIAQKLADTLEAIGWSVWWDREIPFGKPFDQVIEEELNAARCVIVIWSKESVRSRWVKTEAAAAADRERLMPVLIEDTPIPLEFRRIQTAMLHGWNGDRELPEFVMLVDSIRQMLGQLAVTRSAAHTAPATPQSRTRRKIAWSAAAVLLALLGAMLAKSHLQSSDSAPSQAEGKPPAVSSPSKSSIAGSTAVVPTAGSSSAAALPAAPIKGAFSIAIGDRIEDGVPAAGAGNIESPGTKDVYAFSASPRQNVYFRMLEYGKGMEQIKWRLTDSDGAEVFESRLGYSEPGVQALKKGGMYRLTVGSDREPQTGVYRLQLLNVPAPHQFTIKLGDTIKENTPGPGAGTIESPGVKDVYMFTAAAGQRAYFRILECGRGMEQIRWRVTDADGAEVFDSRLGYTEPGAFTLKKGGAYLLTVGSDREPATGTYRLQVLAVPPFQHFSIKVGDTIRENMPAPGAGEIESAGAKDVYTFSAAPGHRVYFRMLEATRGMEQIKWRLTDRDGTEVFDSRLGYTEPGVQILKKGGTYTMTVGSDREPATGTYALQLSNVGG